jgi:hypothetical protein
MIFMPEEYTVEIISPTKKDEILKEIANRRLFIRKANIHGMCIEIITDEKDFKEAWEDNFKFMSDDVRPHGRVVAIKSEGDFIVQYEPISKTCFIHNCDYYGYVKSIALAVAADFLEDYYSIHSRFSIHGSCIDFNGHGIAMIAPSGTGKTTHSYGLLLCEGSKLVADDWFFVQITNNAVAYASEKNSYIRDDIGKNWHVFQPLVDNAKLDKYKRAIVSVEDVIGKDRLCESTTLKKIIILKRDFNDENILRKIEPREALLFLSKHDFCNPHQLVRDKRKIAMRLNFFNNLFKYTDVYMVNTIKDPDTTQAEIRKIVKEII